MTTLITVGGFGRGVSDPQFDSASAKDKKYWRAYYLHFHDAKVRGVDFCLTFQEWLFIWKSSGKLKLRGKGAKKYCMARKGDIGPYSIENVRIILFGENTREAHIGRTHSDEMRMKNRLAKLGKPLSEKHKKNISKGHLGILMREETKIKIRNSNLGKKRSEETKIRISNSKKGKPWSKARRDAQRRK